ncbi:acyl-CoA thioesterase [Acuticoccus kandeliae]|uniref:acyl-CoA thioesterase n=1 Tax=Acuticoccus kandeliae TaxID=2073160 RepID=UPI000D3EA24B|nr:thioesterase family protein [Acuticoccus kandeliae]
MTIFRRTRLIEWGECDAAGIVFYPNFYRWMDAHYHALTNTLGFDQRRLQSDFGLLATPLVDTGCSFRSPSSYGDELTIDSTITHLGNTSFRLAYVFARGDVLAAEGFETRVFVRLGEKGIEKAPIPEAIRALFTPYLTPA